MIQTQNNRRYWIALAVTAASAAVSATFSIIAVLDTGASALSLYAAARSFALVIAMIVIVVTRSREGLLVLAVVMTVVQALDGFIGLTLGDLAKTAGPFVFAILTGAVASALVRRR